MAMANQGDRVVVHFKGTFADGTFFDSSENSGPIVFQDVSFHYPDSERGLFEGLNLDIAAGSKARKAAGKS